MAIELFKHNQDAYTAAVQMLQTTGKAAVIHPTGNGKSFIAFKLCEDQPEKTICWRSPSSCIFKTQLENLRKAGGNDLENIRFFTYARENGNLDVPKRYVTLEGYSLGSWLHTQRQVYNKKIAGTLTQPQIALLAVRTKSSPKRQTHWSVKNGKNPNTRANPQFKHRRNQTAESGVGNCVKEFL